MNQIKKDIIIGIIITIIVIIAISYALYSYKVSQDRTKSFRCDYFEIGDNFNGICGASNGNMSFIDGISKDYGIMVSSNRLILNCTNINGELTKELVSCAEIN